MTREELVAHVAGLQPGKRKRFFERYGIDGRARAALMQACRLIWFKEAAEKLKAELESPQFRAAHERAVAEMERVGAR